MSALNRRGAVHLALSILVGLLSWAAMAWYLETPSGEEWDPIVSYLRDHAGAEDGIAFEPDWLRGAATDLDRMRQLKVLPLKRAGDLPARADLWLYDHSGEVPELDPSRWPHHAALEIARGAKLLHYSARPVALPDEATLHLDRAVLEAFDLEGESTGIAAPGVLELPDRPDWQRVIFGIRRFQGVPHGALRLTPVHRRVRQVSIPGFVFGPQLEVFGGLPDPNPKKRDRLDPDEQIQLELQIDGASAGSVTYPHQPGWKLETIDTTRWSGKTATLALRVRCSGEQVRQFWVQARSRG